jgi:hypothetical protein
MACLGFAAWVILTIPGVNSRNVCRLHQGMSEKRVEEILASPGTLEVEESALDNIANLGKLKESKSSSRSQWMTS